MHEHDLAILHARWMITALSRYFPVSSAIRRVADGSGLPISRIELVVGLSSSSFIPRRDMFHIGELRAIWHAAARVLFSRTAIERSMRNPPPGIKRNAARAIYRQRKREVHDVLDALWLRHGLERNQTYRWLAMVMGMPRFLAHIGFFDFREMDRAQELAERMVAFVEGREVPEVSMSGYVYLQCRLCDGGLSLGDVCDACGGTGVLRMNRQGKVYSVMNVPIPCSVPVNWHYRAAAENAMKAILSGPPALTGALPA